MLRKFKQLHEYAMVCLEKEEKNLKKILEIEKVWRECEERIEKFKKEKIEFDAMCRDRDRIEHDIKRCVEKGHIVDTKAS